MSPSAPPLAAAVSRFGSAVKAKLASAVSGAPEDQLRAPLEAFLAEASLALHFKPGAVVAVGEATLSALNSRPDYAITVDNALVGFIEVKAPGKGADPRQFKEPHDRAQWGRLQRLPNLIYTDGNAFSLWRDGALEGSIVHLEGDVESSGTKLAAPPALATLLSSFLDWEPIAPASARALAELSANLCRLLRDEVLEGMKAKVPALTGLAEDWRRFLFPDADDAEFADGYAQAVTFGLLVARAVGIPLTGGFAPVAKALATTDTVVGAAFRILTDEAESGPLSTSLGTLTRVLAVVDWSLISKGDPEAWLYFYEHFLAVYDNALRKQTGSYYTPPEVVTAMVRLVDEALCDPARFAVPEGLASTDVTLADPATGTGTYLLGVLRRIAATAAASGDGPGTVPAIIRAALPRLIGFELQFGPYVVAQLRLLAEVATLLGIAGTVPKDLHPRLYVTDTLGNPYAEEEYIPQILKPLAESRRKANAVKRAEPITVVLGNPPYKDKAKGLGGWVEAGSGNMKAPLARWQPPTEWGISAHTKHLYNFYVYFWRWATWKVFGDVASASQNRGIICFITVAGFLRGEGFEAMRADLRRTCDEIWVVDCSPEGHQPTINTRIFEGVQQQVCIVLAVRSRKPDLVKPARVRFRSLPLGRREEKFAALAALTLDDDGWVECSSEWRAPFLPAATGQWATYAPLDVLFTYEGAGLMAGRTWVIAPDRKSLENRWKRLISEADDARQELLFHPHGSDGELGDRHTNKVLLVGLPGHEHRTLPIRKDKGGVVAPMRYGFRSFDRQWIIPDIRVLNRPNPTLWEIHSQQQIYAAAWMRRPVGPGPAITFTALIPDHDHFRGAYAGRVFPLWADATATQPNLRPEFLALLTATYGAPVTAEDAFAYLAAVAAHPAYVARFAADLVQPGLRVPLTADPAIFAEAAALGREVIWLHTFGERFADPAAGRPATPPRLPEAERPSIPAAGAITGMPETITYDATARRLHLAPGYVENVAPAIWAYEVSGKQVVPQWFSYRGRDRSRPLIGDRRPPSPLGNIQPDTWPAEYTAELLNLLNVLGRLVALEPRQADLLARICAGATVPATMLATAPAARPSRRKGTSRVAGQTDLLG